MRFPHRISPNTEKEYYPSANALQLLTEFGTSIRPSNLEWEPCAIDRLAKLSLSVIANNFENNQILSELIPQDKDNLLEILSTDLPLELTIPLISDTFDDHYWFRRYRDHFGKIVEYRTVDQSWKSIYLERYVRKIIEEAKPQYEEELLLQDTLKLCAPYVNVLIIKQLQAWHPPKTWPKEDHPPAYKYPVYHVNFSNVLPYLPGIQQLEITFGVKNLEMDYTLKQFEVDVNDFKNLALGINKLENLKYLRITRSDVYGKHVQAFVRNISPENTSLVELDFSYCKIGDLGAICFGSLLTTLTQIKTLVLRHNLIGPEGVKGVAYALVNTPDLFLCNLDLSLNPLGEEGVMPICSALLRCDIPLILSLAGVGLEGDTGPKVVGVLKYNDTLRVLNISSNYFGELGGTAIVETMKDNKTLIKLDMRNTGIPDNLQEKIKETLSQNYKECLVAEKATKSVGKLSEEIATQSQYSVKTREYSSVTSQSMIDQSYSSRIHN